MRSLGTILLTALAFASAASAQSTAGFTGGTLSGPSPRPPNIIIFDVDDIGIESYPQLGAPWANTPTDIVFINTEHAAIHGNTYPAPTASDFPNLNRLLELGVNFQGMWGSRMCVGGRQALRSGHPLGWNDPSLSTVQTVDRSPKRQIQDALSNPYRIMHYGKDLVGGARNINDSGNPSPGSTPRGSGGVVEHRKLGANSNHPGWWWAPEIAIHGLLTDDGGEATTVAPLVLAPQDDPDLFISNGKPMMNQDDWGVEYMFEYITSLYPGTVLGEPLPQSFWKQQSGQPFIVTLGLHYNHQGSGNHCPLQTDGGRIYPSAEKITEMANDGSPGTPQSHKVYTSSVYSEADVTTLIADYDTMGKDWWPTGFACQMDQLKWIDQQLGKTLDWLGPEGLKNTLVIFMGDNGSLDGNLTEREHLRAPHLAGLGQDLTTADAVGSFYLDDDIPTWDACGSIEMGGYCGKGTNHETGIAVPFVVGGGPVAEHLRGTTSTARLQFADISETLVQVAAPGTATGYVGRDFTSLFNGGTAPDLGPTVTSWNTGFAAVLQPDAQGHIYRIWRNYHKLNDHCDYLQDLSRADYWTDLRDDPTAQAAWAELDSFARNYPNYVEESSAVLVAADLLEGRGNVTCGP